MATVKETRSVTWFIFWRFIIASTIGGMIVGVAVAVVLAPVVRTIPMSHSISPYVGLIGGSIVQFFALNIFLSYAVGKSISGKRLVLVDEHSAEK